MARLQTEVGTFEFRIVLRKNVPIFFEFLGLYLWVGKKGDSLSWYLDVFLWASRIFSIFFRHGDLFLTSSLQNVEARVDPRKKRTLMPNNRMQNLDTKRGFETKRET